VTDVINLALPFFGLMLAGAVAARLFHIEERTGDRLNILVLYFALPAMIYRTVAGAPFEQLLNWQFILATSLSTLASSSPPSPSPCGCWAPASTSPGCRRPPRATAMSATWG
jgi:predicted permease